MILSVPTLCLGTGRHLSPMAVLPKTHTEQGCVPEKNPSLSTLVEDRAPAESLLWRSAPALTGGAAIEEQAAAGPAWTFCTP